MDDRSRATRAGTSERLTKHELVRRRADYLRCYRRGRRRTGTFVILYSAANSLPHSRVGITVSRKVGSAVVRQRVKRRVREVYRRWPQRAQLPSVDIVVHANPGAGEASFEAFSGELRGLLRKLLQGRAR